jgi:hypothetical protein
MCRGVRSCLLLRNDLFEPIPISFVMQLSLPMCRRMSHKPKVQTDATPNPLAAQELS